MEALSPILKDTKQNIFKGYSGIVLLCCLRLFLTTAGVSVMIFVICLFVADDSQKIFAITVLTLHTYSCVLNHRGCRISMGEVDMF